MSPKKRGKKPQPMDVPDPGDDDRKRVLNILAQRRYRQRKRERQQALEARLRDLDSAPGTEGSPTGSNDFETLQSPEATGMQEFASPSEFGTGIDENPGLAESSTNSSSSPSISESPNLFSVDGNRLEPDWTATDGFINPEQLGMFDESLDGSLVPFQDPLFPTVSTQKDLSNLLQSYDRTHAFADDATIATRALDLYRAGLSIAHMMSLTNCVFDLNAIHTLPSNSPLLPPNLPSNLRPTAIQQQIPHHPFIDILPWPSVRDRLILVFSQPNEMRPPVARNADGEQQPTMALVQMSHDYEDPIDGCRVYGEDYWEEKSWEVGQAFFERWWWALPRHVVERSNFWRRQRGEGALRVTEIA